MPVNFSTSFSDINSGLFGADTDTEVSGNSKSTTKSKQSRDLQGSSRLEVNEEGINRIIQNILESTGGLADIFSKQSAGGLSGSSSAKIGTENLLAAIAGEIGKLTGETITSESGTVKTKQKIKTKTKNDTNSSSSGLLDIF